MNKKIFALIVLTSINCATPLRAMSAAAAAPPPATGPKTIDDINREKYLEREKEEWENWQGGAIALHRALQQNRVRKDAASSAADPKTTLQDVFNPHGLEPLPFVLPLTNYATQPFVLALTDCTTQPCAMEEEKEEAYPVTAEQTKTVVQAFFNAHTLRLVESPTDSDEEKTIVSDLQAILGQAIQSGVSLTVTTNHKKPVLQALFNAHALRLVESPTDSDKEKIFYDLKTVLEQAAQSGVSLDILTVGHHLFPVHKAADRGHPLVGTVARHYPGVLTQTINPEEPNSTLKALVEKRAAENPKQLNRVEILYKVHKALKNAGTLDTDNPSKVWTSIVYHYLKALNESHSLNLLLYALEWAHKLKISLGEKITQKLQDNIFYTAVEESSSRLASVAKQHGMVPSQEVIDKTKEKAKNPRLGWYIPKILDILLSKPAITEKE